MEKVEKNQNIGKSKKWYKSILSNDNKRVDFWIIAPTIILLCIGLVMVSSASSYISIAQYGQQDYFLMQQVKSAFIGALLMWFAMIINFEWVKKISLFAYFITLVCMLLVFVPVISHSSGGATRWIKTPMGTLQPSEFMKVGLILGISNVMSKNFKKMDNNIVGLFAPIAMIAAVIAELYFQNHMSASIVMAATGIAIVLASGVKIKKRYFVIAIVLVGIVGSIFITSDGFRLKRILAMFNKGADSQGIEWQSDQSILAIGSGKIFGRGISQSRQKYLWLPEAQTDFIFAILAEELGFAGASIVLLCYLIILVRGFIAAMSAKDLFATLVAVGIVILLSLQIAINIAVVTNIIPVTGMPLPLLSHGGTALMINLAMIGLLLNISKK